MTTLSSRPPEASPDFRDVQLGFCAHIRDPRGRPRPHGVEDRRMAIYRELFYNNLDGFLANGFPVLRSISSDEAWHAMVRDFFIRHRCRSPYFREIPEEFLAYLEHQRESAGDPPFLLELAHYEWVELALGLSEEGPDLPDVDPQGDLGREHPVLSPLAWPLAYDYPVHRIGPEFRPEQPEATYLVVYRDRDDEVGFLAINPVTMRLLQLLEEAPSAPGEALLGQVAAEILHPNPEVVVQAGLDILQDLHARDVILGTRVYPPQ